METDRLFDFTHLDNTFEVVYSHDNGAFEARNPPNGAATQADVDAANARLYAMAFELAGQYFPTEPDCWEAFRVLMGGTNPGYKVEESSHVADVVY